MELRDFEYFAVVAEHGQLGRAAEALRLSIPALSKSLRRLERALGAKLARRTSKGVELTEEGTAVLARMRPLRLSLDDLVREVADVRRGRLGSLRVGVHPGMVDDLVAPTCASLLNEAPGVSLRTHVAANDELIPALVNGSLDVNVSTMLTYPHADLVQEHLLDEDIVAFVSDRHPLAKAKHVDLATLSGQRWIIVGHGPGFANVERAFDEHGLPRPHIYVRTTSLTLRDYLVDACDLVGTSSRRVLRLAAKRYPVIELDVPQLRHSRRCGVIYRKGAYLSPVARRFIEILTSIVRT
ncbi:MAG: LysR family transcriptional regulator [Burkholderiales bacterium]|nr:LysR family transcriptional regulator [Burkholderiales bacterium]